MANGGWDPQSDLGFLVDRFLWLKTFPAAGNASVTAILVSDIITGGNTLFTGTGNSYDIAAAAVIFNNPDVSGVNVTVGGYLFPYIHQNNFTFGTDAYSPNDAGDLFNPTGDLQRFTLYAGLIDLKTDLWRFIGEIQGGWGTLENFAPEGDTKISNQIIWAVRGEMYPSMPVSVVGAEFGWADGDKASTAATDNIEGNIIVFSPAYNLDNLLFKHMIPNIYQNASGVIARNESSVQNALYARAYSTVRLNEMFSFTPQVLVAWNNETDNLFGTGEDVEKYLGTEVEGTLTWNVYPGVNFDLIGSLVIAGDGLTDMLEQQAQVVCDGARAEGDMACTTSEADDMPFAVQGRLLVSIDQFFK